MAGVDPEVRFGVSFAVNKSLVDQSNGAVVDYEKDHYAAQLGMGIMSKKDWLKIEDGDNEYYQVDLYVFTYDELKAFIESQKGKI